MWSVQLIRLGRCRASEELPICSLLDSAGIVVQSVAVTPETAAVTYTETLEAMAAGVPVVGWGRLDNFPGVPLHDGKEVFLARRGDVPGLAERLRRVLDDPAQARAMGERGAALIDAQFTLDRVLDAHLASFADLRARG